MLPLHMFRYAIIFLLLFAPFLSVYAEGADELVLSRRAQLERELGELEIQIEAQRSVLEGKQRETVSIERDIAIIDAKIEKARLSIRARNLAIEKLNDNIVAKQGTLTDLGEKIEREKASLAELLRKTNAIDDFSLIEVILSNRQFSDFFEDIDAFRAIKGALNDSFIILENTKQETETEKASLEDRQAEEVELRSLQELEKRRIERDETEKQRLLKISKNEEAKHETIIKEKQKSAAQIRAELFTLRGSAAIPFGTALALAERAGARTGVRPAFILGVIAEESNLGENVGTGNWQVDMHPTRDRPIFEEIAARLGFDPNTMPVSKKPWYGWGGAMGPAQFIPSTWVLYEKKIAQFTGHNPPNPWDPEDAFMAAGILLADNGAARGGYANERLAALRYFAGWANAQKSAYAFYGDDVMDLAAKYQKQVDILAGS